MTKPLTRLAVDNREILQQLDAHGAPESVEAFARLLDRDPSNFRKTLKALEGEGWIALRKPPAPPVELTAEGKAALQGLAVAEGRLKAGLPTLTYAQISPDPLQPRRDFDSADAKRDLAELAESIAERGLLMPLLLRLTGPAEAEIVAGERRWRAIGILIANQDPRWPVARPLPYHVSSQVDEAEILVDQVVENLQRSGLHPLEEAAAFQLLKARGWGVGAISKATGKGRRFVELRLDLLTLPEDLQARMRLPKDDDQHLTATRARELATHLRQVAAGAAEQRDIEELVPVGLASPEEIDGALKVQLEPKDLLALGEIAHAVAARPSSRFPNSPSPVVDVLSAAALQSPALGKLQAAKLATFLLNRDQEPEAAGVRIEPLGHVRLRSHGLHPADNPRALFNLRRDAGMSADQARLTEKSDLYAAAWLNPQGRPEVTPGGVKLTSAEILALVEIAARELLGDDVHPTNPRLVLVRRAYPYTTTGALARSKLAEFTTTPTGARAGMVQTWIGVTPAGEAWLKDRNLWPAADVADVLARARTARDAWTPRSLAEGEFATQWLNQQTEDERAASETYLQHRDEQDRAARNPPPPVADPASTPEPAPFQMNETQVRTLRELAHKMKASPVAGDWRKAVQVGRYWTDLDAVRLWQDGEMIKFEQTDPALGWLCVLMPKGAAALQRIEQEFDPFALEMRIKRHEGRYDTDWLNPIEPEAAGDGPGAAALLAEAEVPADSALLRQIREGLSAEAPDFAQLLRLAGISGPFEAGDDADVCAPNGYQVAVIDPFRDLEEDQAQARAELIAFALNQLIAAKPSALLEIRPGDVVTKGGAMTWRILEGIAKPGRRVHAFRAQPILHGKDYGKPATISLGDITALVEESR